MRQAFIGSAWAVRILWTGSAQAGLTLMMSSETVEVGSGTASLDVLIKGDGITSFGAFTLGFAISSDASNPLSPLESLEFVAPPSDALIDGTLTDANYVFAGNSAEILYYDPSFPSGFGSVSGANLNVGDSTGDFGDVILGAGETRLLARLVFTTPANVTNLTGDKFDITLLDPNGSPTALQSNVLSPSDVPLSGTFASVITVEAPVSTVTPEPGTFGMLLAGLTGMLWAKRRQLSSRIAKA